MLAVFSIGILPIVGGGIGHEIDIRINRRIWSPISGPQVVPTPVSGTERFGLAARVRF
jgi:hypothetical protein